MPSAFENLKLLVWKNYVLQKRHWCQTVFEIVSPVVFATFLILVRCLVTPEVYAERNYTSFSPTFFNLTGRDIGNISSIKKEGTVAFSPENPILRELTKSALISVAEDNLGMLALFIDPKQLPPPKGYPNRKSMERALTRPNATRTILLGIEFEDHLANMKKLPDNIVVKLRFPAVMRTPMLEHPLRASWRTNLLYPLFPKAGPRFPEDKYGGNPPGYAPELFLGMQHGLSREIIKNKTGQSLPTKVRLQRFPHPQYNDDPLLIALERFISMIIMMAYAYPFINIVRTITNEKELQLKETMTIMGLRPWLHWVAWFIKQFSLLLLSVILMMILLKAPFNATTTGDRYGVLTYVSCSVLLFILLLYLIASITFSFMISVFFSRANTAASFMGLAWIIAYSVFMLTQMIYEDISLTTKLALSLISNAAMGYMFQMVVVAEGTARGLQWSDFFAPISYHDQLRPIYIVLMLILDTILYMLIALYVERVRPGRYGVPLKWYFPFTKSYWIPPKKSDRSEDAKVDTEYNRALQTVVHDEEPKEAHLGVDVKNLVKVYGRKRAVDNLNFRIYQNEITVLLGHNGAGKTTTISMMTGMVEPTSGTVLVDGYDIVRETDRARTSIGICPQHNVLFPHLTVGEHIRFYGRLKGVPANKIEGEIDHYVSLLELDDKKNTLSKNLSGGQKRRLSVGAAMCGSSRVVLLDEPTSGLDPAARRALWDLLQKEKKGRTMILTTHFMDEADVLGDRIAIMSGGRLQCIGTPYFLKKHYGIGYKLTIVKGDNCQVEQITKFLRAYVPDIVHNTNVGSELTYILTNEHIEKFPDILKRFEEEKNNLRVSSYGLSVTTLEEVFMRAGAEDLTVSETDPQSVGFSKMEGLLRRLRFKSLENIVSNSSNVRDINQSSLPKSVENSAASPPSANIQLSDVSKSGEYSASNPSSANTQPSNVSKSRDNSATTGPSGMASAKSTENSNINRNGSSHPTQDDGAADSSDEDLPTTPLHRKNTTRSDKIDFSEIQKVKGKQLLRNHIKAMLLKRMYSARRANLVAIIQCASPVVNIAISVFVSRSWKFLSQLPPLPLTLEKGFKDTETLISRNSSLTEESLESKAYTAYKDIFKTSKNPLMKYKDVGSMHLGNYYLKLVKANPGKAHYELLTGATFATNKIIAWFSNFGYHDAPISLALANNAILRALSPNSTLEIVNHPLPYSIENLVAVMASGSSMGFQFAFNMGFCMAFVTAFLVLFVIKERMSGAKLLQRVSGARPAVMWCCSFVWDWLWLAFVYLFIVVPLACFGESTLSTPEELGRVYLSLIVYSVAAIPLHYIASMFFESPATGFAKMCFVNIFLGCMPFLIIEVLKLPNLGSPVYANGFDWAFSVSPLYSLSRCLRDMSVTSFTVLACDSMCEQFNVVNCTRDTLCHQLKLDVCCIDESPQLKWSSPGVGRYLFMMTLVGIILFGILMLHEYGLLKMLFRRRRPRDPPPPVLEEDSDVALERQRVERMSHDQIQEHSLVAKDLTKYYDNFLAVSRLTFCVSRGECFGLLGTNGAGKTSSFRMLTGDTTISAGDAFVHGHSVTYHIRDVHKLIGYCPQFDALLDNLTPRETLRIFCLLRGIPDQAGATRAAQLARSLGFTKHFDKMICQCSGGTKRKVSTAVAMLGDSRLLYLDEPTTGMDPASKRLVWSAVSQAVSAGRSVVLTSHSMEECEALCTRLTVMVNGQLYCLGPLQHLKNKFSQGYTLVIKCKAGPDREANVAKIDAYIMETFPESMLSESYLGISTYYVPDRELPWWRVFQLMQEARNTLPIEDYSVSQTSLEQVFLKFTRASPSAPNVV